MKKLMILICMMMLSVAGAVSAAADVAYEDGVYRGAYVDAKELTIQFTLKDGKFTKIKFRSLTRKGDDWLKSTDPKKVAVRTQFDQLSRYLIGKDVSAVRDLYTPENIAKDIDGMSAATVRSGKLISAIHDALNRGVYSLPK